jgi:hypothetical protein
MGLTAFILVTGATAGVDFKSGEFAIQLATKHRRRKKIPSISKT